MTVGIAMIIVVVLALCPVGTYALRNWGPGLRRCTVWCPVFKMHSDIVTQPNEAAFAKTDPGLTVMDVKRCSLFKGEALRCKKECLQSL